MSNEITTEAPKVFYAVKVNGKIVSPPFEYEVWAHASVIALPDDQMKLAEIVSVTEDGEELVS